MKMKNLLLSLSMAGMCLSQAPVMGAPQQATQPTAASRHVGDGVRSIGDSNRYVAPTPDIRPEEFKPKETKARTVSHTSQLDMTMLAPTACSPSLSSCSPTTNRWFSAESLLWFSEQQQSPALVTTSGMAIDPIAGANGVTTQFGGPEGIDRGLLPGFRVSGGMYFGSDQKVGLGGRAYGIFSNESTFTDASNGDQSIGIPFYNTQLRQDDAYLVAFHNGAQTVSEGSVSARSDLDMFGTDGSLHLLLGRSDNHRSDLLLGYTYNRLRNSIGVASTSTNRFTGDLIPDGTIFETNDLFETDNVFHGAHIGVLSSVTSSRVSLSTLAKVSFGNMRQTGATRGFTNETFGGTTDTFSGGILTQQSNIGEFGQDAFAFIPEMGVKLGYAFRENVQLTVGYTFMFWSSVGLAGDQIDSRIDLTQASGGLIGTHPAAMFQDSTFWMQGIDLGLNWQF